MCSVEPLEIAIDSALRVSGLFQRPAKAKSLLVLAHGAGAGMTHPFLQNLADELAAENVATLRYQFPYMESHRRAPDPPKTLMATVRVAVQAAATHAADLPLFAGGKSMGGRMTSQAAAIEPLTGIRGLVFFGFPLHPPGNAGTKRADHLTEVNVPMLFLQGTRDTFADLKLLRPICEQLKPRATLHIVDTADHSFHLLKTSGRRDADALRELAKTTAAWTKNTL